MAQIIIDTEQNEAIAASPEIFFNSSWTEISNEGGLESNYRFWVTKVDEDIRAKLGLKPTTVGLALNYDSQTGRATVDELISSIYHEVMEDAL